MKQLKKTCRVCGAPIRKGLRVRGWDVCSMSCAYDRVDSIALQMRDFRKVKMGRA